MKLSIIVPAHNEEGLVRRTIGKVVEALAHYNYEIIAVDDNSTDSTGRILNKKAAKNMRIKVVHKKDTNPRPSGLGSALIAGFEAATGDILIPVMADMSDDPRDIPKLVEKIQEGFSIACGSRFIEGSKLVNYPKLKLVVNRLWNRLIAFAFGLKIKDLSNAFKAYSREVIAATTPSSEGFEITAEILLKAHILGFSIAEVPVSWRNREEGLGESKFGSSTPKHLVTRLPFIGCQYGILALKLWISYLRARISELKASLNASLQEFAHKTSMYTKRLIE